MAITRTRRPQATMDMTPMIDCVFQLLIFFMLSSSLVSPQIKLNLPEAKTEDHHDNPEIVISATAGQLFLNQDPIDVQQLSARLRPLLERSRTKVVTFRGDRDINYQRFLQVLDISRQCGAVNMNVMHQ